MSTREPQSRDEIIEDLNRLRSDGLSFWSELPAERFAAPFGDAWSPADNVRHLAKSTFPVTKALKLPKLALRMTFGSAQAPSRAFGELREQYLELLRAGGNAGKFAPSAAEIPEDAGKWQEELVTRLRDAVADLARAVAAWSEEDLDRFLLPHPLLGKLTLREMLFFTLYHYSHHRANVERRLSAIGSEG